MPRRQKKRYDLPPDERGICERMKFARESLGVSQADVAEGMGVSRERITSYEVGRVAVPCEFAVKFCWGLSVSEKWLAEGVIKSREDFRLHGRIVQSLLIAPAFRQIPPRTLYSAAWKAALKEAYDRLEKENGGQATFAFARRDDVRVILRFLESQLEPIVKAVADLDFDVPTDERPPTIRFVQSVCASVKKIHSALKMDAVLTEAETVELIEEAIHDGLFSEKDRHDFKKTSDFVSKHWQRYLRI